MKPEILCIEGQTFENFRRDLNAVLRMAINKMLEIGISKGSVTGRITIEMEQGSENGRRTAYPTFTFDTDMNLPIRGKLESEGDVGLKLAFNGEDFVIGGQNISVFDLLEPEE